MAPADASRPYRCRPSANRPGSPGDVLRRSLTSGSAASGSSQACGRSAGGAGGADRRRHDHAQRRYEDQEASISHANPPFRATLRPTSLTGGCVGLALTLIQVRRHRSVDGPRGSLPRTRREQPDPRVAAVADHVQDEVARDTASSGTSRLRSPEHRSPPNAEVWNSSAVWSSDQETADPPKRCGREQAHPTRGIDRDTPPALELVGSDDGQPSRGWSWRTSRRTGCGRRGGRDSPVRACEATVGAQGPERVEDSGPGRSADATIGIATTVESVHRIRRRRRTSRTTVENDPSTSGSRMPAFRSVPFTDTAFKAHPRPPPP